MKPCIKCGEVKVLSEFYKHKAMGDGHLNKCKTCTKKDVQANRLDKIDYYTEYERKRANNPDRVKARKEYAQTERGKAAHSKAKKKWIENNPIKRKAQMILGNALRSKKIDRPDSCESCGKSGCRIHGHHCDYSKPLEVMWLCSVCHNQWHKENGEGKYANIVR